MTRPSFNVLLALPMRAVNLQFRLIARNVLRLSARQMIRPQLAAEQVVVAAAGQVQDLSPVVSSVVLLPLPSSLTLSGDS